MADKKKVSTFFNTKQSTETNKSSDITNQIKSAIDMSVLSVLNNINQNLIGIIKAIKGKPSKTQDSKENKAKTEKVAEDPQKEVTKKGIKEQKKQAKKLEKSQEKSSKRAEKAEDKIRKKDSKKKDRQQQLDKVVDSIKKAISPLNAFKKSIGTAGKVLSGSSMTVDKNLRDLQIGMGLDTNQAMALQGAFDKMGIDKEDLAFLTQGQSDLLSELTNTMEEVYKNTDMSAISQMGNSMFKIQALMGVLQDVVTVKLQEMMTIFQPILDMVIVLISQIIDAVAFIFESPEFQEMLALIGEVIGALVEMLMPILEGALMMIVDIIIDFMTMIAPIVQDMLPILMMVAEFIMVLLQALMPIIASVLDFIMQLLSIIVPIILDMLPIIAYVLDFIMVLLQAIMPIIASVLDFIMQLLSIIVPIIVMFLEFIMVLLQAIMPIIIPIIEVIGEVLQAMLPIIYTVIASVYNGIISLYNFFVSNKKKKEKMSTKLDFSSNPSFKMPPLSVGVSSDGSKDAIANSYAGSNNISSIKNDTKNIQVDASFNSNITGEASQYSAEIQRTNYSSATLLASILEEGV